jgi:plasmid maintenance system antidote protein VapI
MANPFQLPGDALFEAGISQVGVGAYLREYLLPHLKVTPAQAAKAMDLPPTLFDDSLWNHHPLDHTIARKLSRYTGIDAGFRINMHTACQRAEDRRVAAQPSAQAG